MRTSALLAALAFAAVPAGASADVIPADYEPPRCDPIDCPAGSVPLSAGHGSCPDRCTPRVACESDAWCVTNVGAGSRCAETRFCLAEELAGRAGNLDVVKGACAADGSCAEGECNDVRRCTSPPPIPASRASSSGDDDDGGLCAVSWSGTGSGWGAAALYLVVVAGRRRRQ